MTNPKPWACGVFIREQAISCVLGEVDLDDAVELNGIAIPSTANRIYLDDVLMQEYPAAGVKNFPDPKEAVEEAVSRIVACVLEKGLNLQAVHVACFGGFLSLDQDDKAIDAFSEYGKLTNVRPYHEGWSGLPLFDIARAAFAKKGLWPHIDVGSNVDAAVYGEFLYELRSHWRNDQDRDGNALIYNPKDNGLKDAKDALNETWACLSFSRTVSLGILENGRIRTSNRRPLLATFPVKPAMEWGDDGVPSVDHFRGDSGILPGVLESMVGIRAIEQRCGGRPFDHISPGEELWQDVAYYVAQACAGIVSILAPDRILLIGRVFRQLEDQTFAENLLQEVRSEFYTAMFNKDAGEYHPAYIDPKITPKDQFIRLPARPPRKDAAFPQYGLCGRHGALRLAAKAIFDRKPGAQPELTRSE